MVAADRHAMTRLDSSALTDDHVTNLQALSDSELTHLASRGERNAAGELLARRMPMLSAMARRITLPTIDPDDLLSEAITHLLTKWAAGDGPQDGVDSYLIRSMRNRVIDEIRSPRSKTTTIEAIPEPQEPEALEYHRVELHREFALIQSAFDRLPTNQRRILQATIVDGQKPGDLIGKLAPSAGAVYTLLHRAKQGLQRSLLQTILEDSDKVACKKCAQQLPKNITAQLLDDPSDKTAHIMGCEHCSNGWQRYLFLMSCGGAACLLLVTVLALAPAVPAAASEPSQSNSPSQGNATTPTTTPPPAGAAVSTQAAAPAAAGAAAGAAAAAAAVAAAVAIPLKTPLLNMAGLKTLGFLNAPLAIGTAVLATACGATMLVLGVTPTTHVNTGQKANASLVMNVTSPEPKHTSVNITFSVDQTPWAITDATFVLPAGVTLETAPQGWTCRTTSSTGLTCAVEGANPSGGTMTFISTTSDSSSYRMILHATSNSNLITATTEGAFPR